MRRNVLVELVSANPTGEVTVALGPQRRVRRQRRAAGRVRRARGRRASTTSTTPAARWSGSARPSRAQRRGEPMPEDGYPGADVAELATTLALDPDALGRGVDGGRGAAPCSSASGPASSGSASMSTSGSPSATCTPRARSTGRSARRAPPATSYERDGATWLATTQFGDDKDRVLMKLRRRADVLRGRPAYIEHKFARGHDRLHLHPRRRPPRLRRAPQGRRRVHGLRPRARSRCRSTRWSPSRASGWASGAATSSPPTSWPRRSASTRRGSSSCSARTTRRWTSTSTWPCGRSARTPSTTCSTRTPAPSRSCAARRARGTSRPPAPGRTRPSRRSASW